MSYERIMPARPSLLVSRFFNDDDVHSDSTATPEDHGERIIAAVDAFVRRTGWSHSKLADRADVEPARVTMLLNREYPANWIDIANRLDELLASEARREQREAQMPVMTRTVKSTLGLVNVLLEDGGIGLIQGDSGVGKSEALLAVRLRYPRSVSIFAATSRARPKPMLDDIAARMHVNAYGRSVDEVYRHVVEAMPGRCELLIVDEAHRYIEQPKSIHTLVDLLKETGIPQLWTATGDLMRYLARRGPKGDPFAQVRSRITHELNLDKLREHGKPLADGEHIAELARRKFDVKLDAASRHDLAVLAGEKDGGGLRLVETILKDARRSIAAGMVTRDAIRRAIDKKRGTRAGRKPAVPAPAVAQPNDVTRATA